MNSAVHMSPICLLFLLIISLVNFCSAQTNKDSSSAKDGKWDVAASHGPSKEIECETDEATWTSVDISLDGKKVAFDLLGDIYLLCQLKAGGNVVRGSQWVQQLL